MSIKQRKLFLAILILYTVLILYFLFFGFGRIHSINNEYHFNFILHALPLSFPTSLDYFNLWLFNFGNFAAFIPFGVLIPMLYRCTFIPFVFMFSFSILFIELFQTLSFLGSFDINDAIVNTLGAIVGFSAYKIGFRTQNNLKNFVITGLVAVTLSIAVLGISHIVKFSLINNEGDTIALNQLQESSGNTVMGDMIFGFQIGDEKIVPLLNLYKREASSVERFTYLLNDKDIILSGQYGIPDDTNGTEGKIVISKNGEIVETYLAHKHGSVAFEMPLDNVAELTIAIEGEVLFWDVTITEMNNWWNK